MTVNVQRYFDVNLRHDLLHSYTIMPVALNRLAPFPTISPFIFCTLSWFPELCYFNLPPPSNKFQLPPWKRFLHTLAAERGLEPQQDRLHKKSNNTLLHMFWVRYTVSLETWQSRQVHLLTLRVFLLVHSSYRLLFFYFDTFIICLDFLCCSHATISSLLILDEEAQSTEVFSD